MTTPLPCKECGLYPDITRVFSKWRMECPNGCNGTECSHWHLVNTTQIWNAKNQKKK